MRPNAGGLRSDLVLFAVLAAALAALVLPLHTIAGMFDDDGVYLLGAQSIADGTSYRALHLPGEPYQTKYPPLVPLVLAALMRAFPRFPDNLPWLLLPGILSAAGAACLWRRIVRDRFGFSDTAAIAVCAGALFSRMSVRVTSMTMTEMPFALLATASILCVASTRRGTAPLAGLLAGLATLARSIGVSLPLGFALFLAARRRFAGLALLAGVYGAVMAPWWRWRHAAARANEAQASELIFAYDLDYSRWFLAPADALHVAWVNLVQSLYTFAAVVLGGSVDWLGALIRQGWLGVAGAWLLVLAVAECMALGAWRQRTGLRHPLGAFLGVYGAIVLLWPFESARFYVPVLAVVPTLFLAGLASLAPDSWRERVRTGGAVAYALATAAFLVVWLVPRHAPSPESEYGRLSRLLERVREHTRRDEVLASSRAPTVTLYTGRKSARQWSYDDPLLDYPSGRDLAHFYWRPSPDEASRFPSRARARAVLASMRRAGVERIVISAALDRDQAMQEWAHRLRLPRKEIDADPFATWILELRGPRLERLLAETGGAPRGAPSD